MNYNKSELVEDQRDNAKSSNRNNNKQSSKLQLQTSVIPTFFRWFKKPNLLKHQQFHSGRSAIETTSRLYDNNSTESLNLNFENYSGNSLSPTLSCDSVLSTSTTGFAFIKPNKYGNLVEPKILSNNQLESNSIRCESKNFDLLTTEIKDTCKTEPKLTLKQKYFLFESDTLKSSKSVDDSTTQLSPSKIYSNYDNLSWVTDESDLIQNKKNNSFGGGKELSEELFVPTRRSRSRRTVSDSSKHIHSGAYVHVKGKRKAPHPPSITNNVEIFSQTPYLLDKSTTESTGNNCQTLSPVSTGRKKRKAPPPPPILTNFVSDNVNIEKQYDKSSFSSSESSSLIIKNKNINKIETKRNYCESFSKTDIVDEGRKYNAEALLSQPEIKACQNICDPRDRLSTDRDNRRSKSKNRNTAKSITSLTAKEQESTSPIKQFIEISNDTTSLTPPQSPISLRPWYKRPISMNRESVIPFRREVKLKTMEKSKQNDLPESGLPEVSFSRYSNFSSRNKLHLFTRQKDVKNSKSEQRFSNINIPNISELDREAAAILINESKPLNWVENQTYNPPDHLKLDQKMLQGTGALTNKSENLVLSKITGKYNDGSDYASAESQQSAKDLINKFEMQLERPKVTVNSSYVAKTESFVGIATSSNSSYPEPCLITNQSPGFKCNSNYVNDKTEAETEYSILDSHKKLTWCCSYCTLENPNSRIICEVCEHLKSFEHCLEEKPKTHVIKTRENISDELPKSIPTTPQNSKTPAQDWKWKAEIVKKYFSKPENASAGSIKTLNLELTVDKSSSSFLVDIPETNTRKQIKQDMLSNENSNKNLIQHQFDEKLDVDKNSECQINNNDLNPINFEQIRMTRLLKFNIITPSNIECFTNIQNNEEKENILNDPNLLEKEKQRLREKIRAMNAKALAEKYPILKKNLSIGDPCADTQTSSQQMCKEFLKKNENPTSSVTNSNKVVNSDFFLLKPEKNLNEIQSNEISSTKGTKKSLNEENGLNILKDEVSENEIKLQVNEMDVLHQTNESSFNHKSGAVKKISSNYIFPLVRSNKDVRTQIKSPKNKSSKFNSDIYIQENKPVKVSSSCQTSGLIKKSSEYDSKTETSLNALISPIKNFKFKNDEVKFNSKTSYKNNDEDDAIIYKDLSHLDKEQVKEISRKLTSAEGRSNFKRSLDNGNVNGISHTDTLVLNKILRNLEQAISEGKHELAAKLAMDLAKMKVSLHVTKLKSQKACSFDCDLNQNFIVDMFIEDRISQKGPIQISVNPLMTVEDLKKKVLQDYNIPIQLQNWIINEELLYNESLSLFECGVKNNLANLYLYILTPPKEIKACGVDYKFTIPKTSKAFQEDDFNDQININSLKPSDNCKKGDKLKDHSNTELVDNNKTESESCMRSSSLNTNGDTAPWKCSLCTLINNPLVLSCSACSKAKPITNFEKLSVSEKASTFLVDDTPSTSYSVSNTKNSKSYPNNSLSTTKTITSSSYTCNAATSNTSLSHNNFNISDKDSNEKVLFRPKEQKNDLSKTNPSRKSTELYNIVEEDKKPTPRSVPKAQVNATQQQHSTNFSSPNITKNKYRGVDNFNPYRKDNDIFLQYNNFENNNVMTNMNIVAPKSTSASSVDLINKNFKSDRTKDFALLKSPYSTSHYLELVKLHNLDVVRNFEPFECPICFENIEHDSGVVLRECLHTFCKDCLVNTIIFNEEAQVKCPYMDTVYSCNSFLQEREIKSLVTKDIFEKHLAKSIKLAEHYIENAFHCKTANCRGWCIYEDSVNEFLCPVCNLKNCLTCAAIHDGITCKQYQDGLNDCDNNENSKRTKEMFREMVEKGEALNCPTCQVIMMKKWGCDWLKCSMCKTEICWVTKGPRWGPAGKGDTSGGCKCGVNGIKCHPKCNYCH
ncbi:uncharacterized protein LOC129616332 isoform X2 [Condylostylus longicornis]|uniref:uncharacterized protein LOC129616332 isoform X2 n=1 Tax=Condylostylus longicornis TaxID=2530218 RepID=UPI00244E121C|nr:uncharacterized protein LOC129616332 isoform X2 [Condylostylus longicornis]